jgi:endonuclease III
LRTPLAWVLWHNVAYLVDDEHRLRAYRALERRVGLEPKAIAAASTEDLLSIAKLGGPIAEKRVEKLKACAQLALTLGGGDLGQLLTEPTPKARRALERFPSIGAPGAVQVLLFCDAWPVLALESNGLRVLLRLGFGVESDDYPTAYRSAQRAASAELPDQCAPLQRAYQLLRVHGQTTCKRSEPHCTDCVLATTCPSAGRVQVLRAVETKSSVPAKSAPARKAKAAASNGAAKPLRSRAKAR